MRGLQNTAGRGVGLPVAVGVLLAIVSTKVRYDVQVNRLAFALLVALGASCTTTLTEYHCDIDPDCFVDTTFGSCEPAGFCSFEDQKGDCVSGRRYGSSSGALSNTCVGDGVDVDARAVIPADAREVMVDADPSVDAGGGTNCDVTVTVTVRDDALADDFIRLTDGPIVLGQCQAMPSGNGQDSLVNCDICVPPETEVTVIPMDPSHLETLLGTCIPQCDPAQFCTFVATSSCSILAVFNAAP